MDSSSYGVKAELEHTFLSDSNSKDGVDGRNVETKSLL